MTKYDLLQDTIVKRICKGIIIALLLAFLLQPQTTYAHGGVIMDGGFTPEYEWLVLSANSPLVEGLNLMSFVIYDINTYEPIDGMRVEVLIAHPSSRVECCNADEHVGPIELEADPENWPGDYSYPLPLDGFGNFQLKFIAYKGNSDEPAIEAISTMLVLPDLNNITPEPNPNLIPPDETGVITSPLSAPGQAESPLGAPLPGITKDIAITGTAASTSQSEQTISASNGSTTQAPISGGTTAAVATTEGETLLDKLRRQWILWTMAGLIPLAMLAFLLFRPSVDELVAQKEAELAAEADDDIEDFEEGLDD